MTIDRISSIANASPEGDLTDLTFTSGSRSINALYTKYKDGRVYAEQRPGFNALIANPEGGNNRGRAMTYMQKTNSELGGWYVVIDKDVYIVNATGAGISASIGTLNTSTADDRGAWITVSDDFVIFNSPYQSSSTLDPAVSYIETSVSESTVNVMSDGVFTGTVQPVAGGGVALDGYMFFLNRLGEIWNSDLNDPSTWTGTSFLEASREADTGLFLAKHHDNIVAFGGQTIEFFTNVGNSVGSPLQRRADIYYNIGVKDAFSVAELGDLIFFIGRSEQDTQLNVYVLDNFRVRKVSTDAIAQHLNTILATTANTKVKISTSNMLGHPLCHLIFFTNLGVIKTEYIYDMSSDFWGTFETDMFGTTQPPGVVSISGSGLTPAVRFEDRVLGLLYSGDIMNFQRGNATTDFLVTGSVTENVVMTLTLPEVDMGTSTEKFCYRLTLIGSTDASTSSDVPATIRWSDDHYNTFSSGRTVTSIRALSNLPRLGKFKRRAFEIEVDSADRVRIEALEVDTRRSLYA